MTYCADTDFLIDLKDQNRKAIAKVEELESQGEMLSTTAINVAEFYFGVYRSNGKESALAEANKLFEPFSILDLNFETARLYGELAGNLKSNMVAPLDLLIASIALSNKQRLLTRNKKHFERVPGLHVEGW
jgi:tRNA(fMet)-specific endonuclease VapC